ncbi:coiled-coil domain-containing protein 91 isoform X2 [Rhinatrema bivittatum]|nr:coiled-coil domain-containing protein 91 isoform X2 [Rhinatrema bivittatum]XP_029455850.1 coiled-coil domain-containing protein 91 isoform X2 [Rhinatrema bivittatum]XP_029455851.1 coiled-coil domain-containing protein 91 isoform X2 [Rhinatrema bivittatum]XP_029455852.1 coiled-coil domain-containing protein 91 isoform X2 [Rhinatrema bivittatum]
MDDDDFGGFEAAETFEGGNGETQTTSPAIPWVFPAVPGVHITQAGIADISLDQSNSSACLDAPVTFMSSGDNSVTPALPVSAVTNLSTLQEQVQLSPSPPLDDASVSSLSLTEEESLENLTDFENNTKPEEVKRSNMQFQQTIASLDVKLKAAEKEKCRIKRELEDMMKQNAMEKVLLKEKDEEIVSHQIRYKQLQERHKNELEEMRKAGHEALSIIVEEFKALLQSAVQQQEETSEKQFQSAIEKQTQKCEGLLNSQCQRLFDMLDKEKEELEEKIKEVFAQQLQEQKEVLEKCVTEEKQKSKEALLAAAKIEQDVMEKNILKAVEEERQRMETIHSEEKELWKREHTEDQEKISVAIQEAIKEERKKSQEIVKEVIVEEQKKSEKAVEEAVKQTKEELMEYFKEQKRLDQVARQRNLSSLELFLSCAQKQLSSLIEEKPIIDDRQKE